MIAGRATFFGEAGDPARCVRGAVRQLACPAFLSVLAFLAVQVWLAAPAAAAPRATVTGTKGMVRVARAGTEDWLNCTVPHALYAGDRIRVVTGRADISFDDGSVVRLRRRTTFEISQLQDGTAPGSRKIVTKLLKGMVRILVQKLDRDSEFSVHSNQAIAAVKGTDLVFDGQNVTVLNQNDADQHQVLLTDPNGEHGVLISEDQSSGIQTDGTIPEPHQVDPQVQQELRQDFQPATPGAGQPETPSAPGGEQGTGPAGAGTPPTTTGAPAAPGGSPAEPGPTAGDTSTGSGETGVEHAVDVGVVTGGEAPLPPAPVDETCTCGCDSAEAKCK